MNNALYNHIKRFVDIDKAECSKLLGYFDHFNLAKKDTVTHAGEKCDHLYFVLQGCLHTYFIDNNGAEKTIQFAIEDWWITDFLAYHHQIKTEYCLQAVEASKVLCITYEKQQELFAEHPVMESYFRKIYEVGYGAAIRRLQYIFTYSKEEIFYRFRDEFPEFVNRVPQYLIATYLGLTPEYVSKLRRKPVS
ncbi:Crp/Fnr family transcriptional regulator [Fulvivirga sp. 29W222]|uniref:Crp/Fnr family transcriptional regulator n=1 Tax=Fulvivirga marina TaxID=2494733 RepID=A0A937FXP2_9BACT|nr:Crp/Fnr family transcriptional regulator [Fulvivirga marina]MBL6447959.1 Crp/Fnr family transcriptional regulator [Fulvivirga marina]